MLKMITVIAGMLSGITALKAATNIFYLISYSISTFNYALYLLLPQILPF
jgi:hypothetical protein